ncbi:unnamed protein product, partial [Penicillium nalgiovense]
MRPADIISSVPPPFKHPLVHALLSVISNVRPTFCVTVPLSHRSQHRGSSVICVVPELLNSDYTFCIRGLRQQCDFFSLYSNSSDMSLRPCQPCRSSKIRCTREFPHCQSCIKRGRCSLCVYETEVSDQKPALPKPQSKRRKQKQEQASGEYQFRWRAFEPQSEQILRYEMSTNEEMQHVIQPTKEADTNHLHQRHSGRADMGPHEMSPKSIAATTAEENPIYHPEYGVAAVEDTPEGPQSILLSQPTPCYAQTIPPASLPPRPNFDLTISGRHICGPHTTHQLLLVLS